MLLVTIYCNDYARLLSLPEVTFAERDLVLIPRKTGRKQELLLHFYAADGIWRLRCPDGMHWNSESALPINRVLSDGFNISAVGDDIHFGLYCRAFERENTRFIKYEMQDVISIGSANADIVINDRFISEKHGVIIAANGGYFYRDTSKNGSFINNRHVCNAQVSLKVGDVISMACGVRIAFYGDVCAINQFPCLSAVKLRMAKHPAAFAQTEQSQPPYIVISRSPHFYPSTEVRKYTFEPAPSQPTDSHQPLILSLGPSLTMGIPMLAGSYLAGTGAYSKSGVYMMLTSSVLATAWMLINHFYSRHLENVKYSKQLDDYIQRLGNLEQDIEHDTKAELDRLLDMYPAVDNCARFVTEKSEHIWRNRPELATFMAVRLGVGMLPPPCKLELPHLKMGERPDGIFAAPFEAATRLNKLCRLPVHISFADYAPVGIVCPSELNVFVQGLILQLVVLNSYRDMRIAVFGADGSRERWGQMRMLPHTLCEGRISQHMIATDERSRATLLEDLSEMCKRGSDNSRGKPPRCLIISETNTFLSDSGFLNVAAQKDSGFALCALATRRKDLPKECVRIIEIEDAEHAQFYDGVIGTSIAFTPELSSPEVLEDVIAVICRLRESGMKANNVVPTSVSFLESFGVRCAKDMEIWHNWCRNSVADNIQANLGFRAGSVPFWLDLSDKAHGPHGLVAGTTGSGKSVLLQTLVLSLACRYSPTELQFVLIDYKGGGTFECFRNMPHVVGLVDNLAGRRTILRALASVNGEVLRRQQLFKDAGVSSIDDYIRLCNPNSDAIPLSHIIIIIDEFAELKDEMPSFIDELVSVSRIGRSLGIHLILATQKPSSSVSNEIRSNARFRLCLRVQTREDSMEVINHPDAAFLKGMGSAWVQVGNDEILEQIQTSWNGGEYDPEAPVESAIPHLLDSRGETVRFRRSKKKDKSRSEMDVLLGEISDTIQKHASDSNREKLYVRGQLWLQELSFPLEEAQVQRIFADCDVSKYPNDICIPFGLLDDVLQQRQFTAVLHLNDTPVVAVIGSSTDGKTTLMQSLIYSACSNYTPDKLQVCVVSFNGAQLSEFKDWRNVVGVVRGSNTAALNQFIYEIRQEAQRRREIYDQCGATGHLDCAAMFGKGTPPALLIVIDRLGQMMEQLPDDEQSRFVDFIKNASANGFYFCFTAIDRQEIPYALRESTYFVPLCRNNLSDYSLLLNEYRFSANDLLPERKPGRGMMRIGDRVYELQTAAALGISGDNRRREALREFGKTLHVGIHSKPALRLVDISSMLEVGALCKVCDYDVEEDVMRVPFALKRPELMPLWLDSYDSPRMFVLGKSGTGKTSFMMARAEINAMHAGGKCFVLCKSDAWNSSNAEVLHVQRATSAEWSTWLTALLDELQQRRDKVQTQSDWDKPENGRALAAQFAPMLLIMDDMEQWYGMMQLPDDFNQALQYIKSSGGQYNISLLCACGIGNTSLLPNEQISDLLQGSVGIATGNTLVDSNPWYVDVSYSRELERMRAGDGFLIEQGQKTRIMLPGKVR